MTQQPVSRSPCSRWYFSCKTGDPRSRDSGSDISPRTSQTWNPASVQAHQLCPNLDRVWRGDHSSTRPRCQREIVRRTNSVRFVGSALRSAGDEIRKARGCQVPYSRHLARHLRCIREGISSPYCPRELGGAIQVQGELSADTQAALESDRWGRSICSCPSPTATSRRIRTRSLSGGLDCQNFPNRPGASDPPPSDPALSRCRSCDEPLGDCCPVFLSASSLLRSCGMFPGPLRWELPGGFVFSMSHLPLKKKIIAVYVQRRHQRSACTAVAAACRTLHCRPLAAVTISCEFIVGRVCALQHR